MNMPKIISLGDGFFTDTDRVREVFGKFKNEEGDYNVEGILDFCKANEWERWLQFWEDIQMGKREVPQ